jgi:aryl-alcohol dehydrogenase-like predicted oxidoreductase
MTSSALGIGCMEMSVHYGRRDAEEGIRTIHRAIDLGVTLFDTADVYGPFTNEALVGRALRGHRDRVNVTSKVGLITTSDGTGPKGDPAHIVASCEGSLRRLGVDHLDLYYLHRVDPNVPVEDTIGAMAELVEKGKVRFLGLSEAPPETIRRAVAVHRIEALQSEWSLWCRGIEGQVLPLARELGIAIVPYCPLGRGFLTGSLTSLDDLEPDDIRRGWAWFQAGNFQANVELAGRVRAIALELGSSPAQLALAWLLAQGHDVFPIPGTDNVRYLEENVAACDIVLTPADLDRIELLAPPAAAISGGSS